MCVCVCIGWCTNQTYWLLVEGNFGTRCNVRVLYCRASKPRLVNLWHTKRYPWHTAVTAAPQFFFICFAWPVSLHCDEYVDTYHCAETVHELPVSTNNTASEAILHKSGWCGSADWIFLSGATAWLWWDEYSTTVKTFYDPRNKPLTLVSNRRIPVPAQRRLHCFCNDNWATERLAMRIFQFTLRLCSFMSGELIRYDKHPQREITNALIQKWKVWGKWQIFTVDCTTAFLLF